MYTIKKMGIVAIAFLVVVACSPKTGQELASEETVKALDLSLMDTSVDPADDFFRYVNGKWIDQTPIPSDQGRWGSFNELREDNNEVVLQVLETSAKSGKYKEGSDQQKAALFYTIGMDSMKAEIVGDRPLKPWLEKIEAIQNKSDLQDYIIEQQTYGGGAFFNFFVFTDLKNSNMVTAYLAQGGLGLPDRDYYTKTDAKSKEIQDKYIAHVSRMLQLIGDDPNNADAAAKRIYDLEFAMAEASMTNVERRNIPALYNKYAVNDLGSLSATIDWEAYFKGIGANTVDTIIVMQPKFMENFEQLLNSTPMSTIKEYLRWHAVDGLAPFLSAEFEQANFDFFSKELRGIESMRPRWKRVLAQTNGALGEAIGKLYVDETFPPEAKAKANAMVDNIIAAFGERIKKVDWMTEPTKQKALEKLEKMTVKIGYPDEWRDYSGLKVDGDPETSSYADNVMNAAKFEFNHEISKLGKPVNKKEWGMTPQTVNAYFNPTNNEIVFPAAILQPPFYNYKADEAVNYGGIGAVIGHEISHCFDDQGSRFDAEGNMTNWWSEEDFEQFKARTAKLVAQYDAYEPLDSVFVNGEFTLGENIGDLGGVNAAYDGLQMFFTQNGRPESIDDLTAEQRFFISWGTIWRIKYKDETLRTQVNTDPHSPGMYRATGPLVNVDAFYTAFNVEPDNAMYKSEEERVRIW